jgi:hypothetical protein
MGSAQWKIGSTVQEFGGSAPPSYASTGDAAIMPSRIEMICL